MPLPNRFPARTTIASAVLLATLTACGGDSTKGEPSSTTSGLSITSVTVTGSVGDGPVTGADLGFYDANGSLIATARSDNMANFSVNLGYDAAYPMTVVAQNGIDVVTGAKPTFDMVSIIESPNHKIANINPYSTLVVKMAARMPGGFTGANLQLAKDMIGDKFSFGLDKKLISDPVNSAITDANAAVVVKSSEVLAELIRRVHGVLGPQGQSASENEVLDVLAADLTDGFLDGEGTAGANPLTAAVAKITEAQVLVEALTNDLKVNGRWATGAMDDALRLIKPGKTLLTSNVDISNTMLAQADTSLAAVGTIVPSADITAVRTIITDAMASGTSSALANLATGTLLDTLVMSVKPERLQPQTSYNLTPVFETALTTVTSDTTATTTLNTTERTNKRNTAPKIAFYSNDATVPAGTATLLNWSASNSVSCGASGGWSGAKPVSGNESTANLSNTTDFSLKCFGSNGKNATATVTVAVTPTTSVSDTGTVTDTSPTAPATVEPSTVTDISTTPPATVDTGTSSTTPTTTTGSSTNGLVIRVNAGGGDYTDNAGNLWQADYAYNTGNTFSVTDPVSGTLDDTLYQSERWDAPTGDELAYSFDVPNGRYVINLHFMDRASSAGWRRFDVLTEGRLVLDNLDIYAEVGAYAALTKGVAVDVTDGQLNIRFLHVVENPKINAIEIIQVDSSVPTTPPITTSSVTTAPIKLSWSPAPSTDNITGYLVYYGGDENSVSIPASDIRADSVGFIPAAPSLTYQPETDLGLQAGNRVCFKIRAYNADGLSGWSVPICGLIAQAI